ncbi:family 16 glycoside hydrolase [Gimesia chilikensis]|uniref:HEAT repeat protein n=1 Tax=Gimesia chilikensis TaxID=2605989 RepID=A0A517PYU8_9PLAN|nr:family 16 glycoside hydrolase [Gimesia chilikensis]QDT24559.1 HEAT repeat protein [Gimesia chilikensis]
MFSFRFCLLTILSVSLFCSANLVSAAEKSDSEATRLVNVLNSDASTYDKAMACRRLAAIGDAKSVPAIAKYLGDEKLATYARSALENIPADAADQALEAALKSVKGDQLVGVINSLAKRRDKGATAELAKLLANDNPKVAIAAAHALGAIGTSDAAATLKQSLGTDRGAVKQEVAFALLMCARSLADSNKGEAVELTEVVLQADLPENVNLAATQRAIVLLGKDGFDLLAKTLKADDLARFRAGLQAARKVGPEASTTLVAVYPELSDERKGLVIAALSQSKNASALPLIQQALKSDSEALQLQAVLSLGELVSVLKADEQLQVLGALFGKLKQSPSALTEATADTIGKMNGSQTADKVQSAIEESTRKLVESEALSQQLAGLQLAGDCRLSSLTPAVYQLVGHSNPEVKQAAIQALGGTTSSDDLPKLITLAVKNPGDAAISDALKAACSRLPLEETAQTLAQAMDGASIEQQQLILNQLAAIGGETALKTVVQAARSNEDALQNTATDLLGKWVTIDVAPPLLDLAQSLENRKYQIRALRGYIRVARQLNMTPAERLEVCRNTLANAERNDEKKLVFEVLRRYPTPEAVNFTINLLKEKDLNVAASATIVSWAERGTPIENTLLRDALQQVITTTDNAGLKQRAEQQLERISAQAAQEEQALGFQPLYDGKTFNGWHGNEEIFRIEDGEIVAGSLTEKVKQNEFLRSDKEYEDFELILEFKLLGEKTNAGVQIRTAEIPDDHEVSGFQADLGTGYWGCLYDESRRRKILAGPPKEIRDLPVRMNDWNTYRIRCQGPRIQLWINGVQTVDYVEADPQIPLKGIIALQIHGNLVNQVHYRNMRLREL